MSEQPYYAVRLSGAGLCFDDGQPFTINQIEAVIAVLKGQVKIQQAMDELDKWVRSSLKPPEQCKP